MKKFRTKLTVVLMIAALIMSFEFASVFAAEEQAEAAVQDTVTEQEDEPITEDTTTELTAPELEAYASCESVVLEWTDVEGEDGYNVYAGTSEDNLKLKKTLDADKTTCKIKDLTAGKKYYFQVEAYTGDATSPTESAKSDVERKAPVRTITYKVKIKQGTTLQSHGIVSGSGAKKKSYTIKTGQWLDVDRYGAGGKYIFTRNNNIYYCNLTRTTSQKCVYASSFNYSDKEAEFYVNAKKLTSKTKYLVWISTYCQHIYVFKGSKGNWVCQDSWECATGKAKTPTPTGITGKKAIWQKIAKRHSIPYWSSFSDINSIHGKKGSWTFGKPASNGCVRNPNAKAKYVYNNCKIGTTVFVY